MSFAQIKLNIYDFIGIILGVLILFVQPLKILNPMFSYIDELLLIVILLFYIYSKIAMKSFSKLELYIWGFFILFILVGLISNGVSNYNRSISAILVDIESFAKFFIIIICGISFWNHSQNANSVIKIISFVVKVNVLIAFVLGIMNQFFDLGMRDDVRYGIQCFTYIYDTAAIFSWYCYMFLIVLSIDYFVNNKKTDFCFILINCITWVLTGRSRAFAFIAIFWVLYIIKWYQDKKNRAFRINIFYVAILGALALIIAWNQFSFYFTTETQARSILFKTGFSLGKRFFPFGSGLSTFGTFGAQKYYSPVYYEYGLVNIWGFTAVNPLYLTDNCWPAIFGETGLFGLISYIIAIYLSFKYLYNETKINNGCKMIILFFIVTVICSSIATTIFTQNATIGDVFFITMICGVFKNGKEEIS